jgi:4-hydroxybenzoate polyprenyltransferase
MLTTLKRLFSNFIFGNFFIAFCAAGMVLTTFLMNSMPLRITPFTVFITLATFLLYNFHRISFKLDYSGWEELKTSIRKVEINQKEKFFFLAAAIGIIICLYFLNPRIFIYLVPLALLSLSYSIPVFGSKRNKKRLLEIFLMKTPVLALVWGLSTTIIPLIEQNISLSSSFIILQIISRSLFIFALCIPFEIRDVEADKKNNVKTLPVIYGVRTTGIIGVVIILLEIITHHLMPSGSLSSIIALDLSSIVALCWIFFQSYATSAYFYKFYIDGTMLVRFFFLLIAIHKL